jgi:hypothetical protein
MHDVYSSHRVFLLLKTKLQKGYLVTLRKSVRTAVSSLLVGALLALMGCGSSKATLRVLNATPNESQIDVSLDSTSFATSVSYGTATGYSSVTSGSRDLEIYPSGVTSLHQHNNRFEFGQHLHGHVGQRPFQRERFATNRR